jgi:hypothetical protein
MTAIGITKDHPDTIDRSIRAIVIIALRTDSDFPPIIAQRVHLAYTVILTVVAYSIVALPASEWIELRCGVHVYLVSTYQTCLTLCGIVENNNRVTGECDHGTSIEVDLIARTGAEGIRQVFL